MGDNCHSMDAGKVLKSLKSSVDGLTEREAGHRLESYGPNELEDVKRISPLQIFLRQFKNFLIMILIVAVVISALIGDGIEALVIFAIVIFAVLLGFIQEYRAETAIAALKRMAAPVARVLRDGEDREIPGRELVPGDVVLLGTGSLVPADIRLVEGFNLRIDEAPLTGESVPVEKGTRPLRGKVPLGDRVNMAYMGTHAVYGRGKGVVVATGMATEFGKIAGAIILTDDNFASIVAAVEEGRIVFGNIKKYLMYLLSSNLGEILLMTTAVLAGLPLPLVAVQILYVNLATDGLPALALSVDPPEKKIMRRRPRDPKKSIFAGNVWKLMVIGGVWSAVVNLGIFVWALDYGKSLLEAQSMVFVSLILIQFFKAYNYRSDIQSVFKLGFFTNRWLNLAVLWESLLLLLIIYIPVLQGAFNTYSLTRVDWMIAFMAAITIFPVLEVSKRIAARAR